MVPTGHSWNIMELQYEGRVPDGEGQEVDAFSGANEGFHGISL